MKVVFLDIDGVLNHEMRPKGMSLEGPWMDPEHTAHLEQLRQTEPFVIVFSTSWRITHSQEALTSDLRVAGCDAPVIGCTPNGAYDSVRGLYRASVRGFEIAAWLRENLAEVDSYVVLDDCSRDDMPIVGRHFVKIPSSGLREGHLPSILRVLGTPLTNEERDTLKASGIPAPG
jgi:hypothetical protein